MATHVANVITKQGRDITDLVNTASRPTGFLTMLYGENSSLDETSHRDMGRCDVSGNLPHISICRAVEAHLVPAGDADAFWAWTANTPVVLATARDWFEPLIAWAEQTLGMDDARIDLLSACWWNAPNAGAVTEARLYGTADPRTRAVSAEYWLAADLATRPGGTKYAANRNNYVRGEAQTEKHRVVEAGPVPPVADAYVIGEGVRRAMAALGDVPRSNELYWGTHANGMAHYSLTQGRDAEYRWTPEDGVMVYRLKPAPPDA